MTREHKVYDVMRYSLEALLEMCEFLLKNPDKSYDSDVAAETINLAKKAIALSDIAIADSDLGNNTLN